MCRQKNISRPLCVDRRTKEQTQTYVIMYLCPKGQMNILEPLCVDKRKDSNLCHYVLMSKQTKEHIQTIMCRQKNKKT